MSDNAHATSVVADAPRRARRPRSVRSAVDLLVEENLPLVGHIVRQIAVRLPDHVAREDLISAGMAALVASARSFDTGRGIPFTGFATFRIRGAVLDELRGMDWASRSVRGKARRLETVRGELTAALGRAPRPEELANAMGVTLAEMGSNEADVQRASVLSLQGFAPETGALLVQDRGTGPEQTLLNREQLGLLHDAIDVLPERLAHVVRSYFFDQRPMAEIAAELGVTASRVSQIRAEALTMLRAGLAANERSSATAKQSTRTKAKEAAYAAAVASRGTLATRLQKSTVLGDIIAETYRTAAAAPRGCTA
ncbi:sigma-70 family RNA polymerase sigma factor [Rhodococcus sp. X156]|uniref:sigma-70 family RNA polymerase sigma factor n=1 Tax=Rhodococcus sp. X156 TaxID=2499145 RepID=UPI000FD7A87F|nr:sigma-70 family RNA polymerase sigma factor [Rhodococcus sp. X156]